MDSDILIHVYTGDRRHAGTDATVHIILYDVNNSASSEINMGNFFKNDFERGQLDTFEVKSEQITALQRPVKLSRIQLWKDSLGFATDWFVDKIEVENKNSNERFIFPFFRWINPNFRYNMKVLGTSLPQNDEYDDQRRQTLEDKRAAYQLAQKLPDGPVQVKSLPDDESFSFSYKWDIVQMLTTYKTYSTGHLASNSPNFTSIEDMKSVYNKDVFPQPADTDKWDDDIYFGNQRVASVNHAVIALLKEIPAKFPVTDDLLKPFLEGNKIQDCISQKKLFICDLEIMKDIPTKKGFVVCAPICLLYLDSGNNLKPVAIQLYQTPGRNNPIFTPSSPKLTWALAKLWYNSADASYHESLTHLGLTHLLMEGVTLACNRNLAVSHPIFKILAPHFLYLMAINALAVTQLLAPGALVDQFLNCGLVGLTEVIRRGFARWRMDVHGTLPEDLKQRGLDDENVLPGYHYRNDALLVYNAIQKYVQAYVDLYYTSPEVLTADYELQNWAQELVKERAGSTGGIGIKGVPGGGHITSNAQLTQIVTSIIYTCSVGHASANFPQYEEYGFPPKYPAMMKGTPPTSTTVEITEKDLLKSMANRSEMLNVMSIMKILSTKGTNSLGDFEVQYVVDPAAIRIINKFREDLQRIGKIVDERNQHRSNKYEYLHPTIIPNSISI
ncbi:hypothetical protein BsWGS_09686 [Bradybaena similaris]